MTVLGVEDGGGHSKVPVEADGHQVEDGGGAAGDVHGEVEVTDTVWKVPVTPVGLKICPWLNSPMPFIFLIITDYFLCSTLQF